MDTIEIFCKHMLHYYKFFKFYFKPNAKEPAAKDLLPEHVQHSLALCMQCSQKPIWLYALVQLWKQTSALTSESNSSASFLVHRSTESTSLSRFPSLLISVEVCKNLSNMYF